MWEGNKSFSWFRKAILVRPRQSATVQKSGLFPPSLVEEARVPRFYRETIAECGADSPSKLPEVNEVLALMWRSGLAQPILQAIWESVAPANKERLNRQEFYSCLALIALAQRNLTISDLSGMASLPIPKFSSVKPKEAVLRNLKSSVDSSVPNPHLLKTVHPLFTEQNVKLEGDLISFAHKDGPQQQDVRAARDSASEAKLLANWEKLVDSASGILSLVQQTSSSTLAVFNTREGYAFVHALHEVVRVVQRVYQAARGGADPPRDLVSRCEILLGVWENLLGLLEKEELLERPSEFELTEHVCSVCGLRTNADNTHFDKDTEKSYHISCANFWLNTIETSLPD